MADNTIQWDKDADGIVTLTLDDPRQSANVDERGLHRVDGARPWNALSPKRIRSPAW